VKMLVWTVALILASGWTLLAAMTASIAQWFAANAGTLGGDLSRLPEKLGSWPAPPWLAGMNAELLAWLKLAASNMLESLSAVAPSVGSILQWVPPAVWAVWAIGLVCLLVAAGAGHYMVGRLGRPGPRSAQP
jgi:hypothetical protein